MQRVKRASLSETSSEIHVKIFIPYYSQNIRLKIIHYTCCLNLRSVGKRLKKSMQQVLALRQSRYFFNVCDRKHRDSISHIERTVNVLGEDPTKITITNASIDKQITLKRVYIYKIENTDLEIRVSGVLLRILFYFEARRCSRQTGVVYALRINLLYIMIQRTLQRGRGTSIINEVKRIK